MNYTWRKDFYDDDDEIFTLKQSIKWNKMQFGFMLKSKSNGIKNKIRKIREYTYYAILPYFRKFNLELKTKIIKLKLRDKEDVQISYSPFSESRYFTYIYLDECIKIRVSMHGASRSDNSHIFVFA